MPGLFDKLLRRRKLGVSVSREVAERASDHLLDMDEALEQLAELPGLEDFKRTRELPAEFLPLWDRALAAYDAYVQTMTTGPRALAVRCQAGCAACCHDVPTGVQAVELLAIYASYREFDDFAALHNQACDLSDELTALLASEAPGEAMVRSDSPEYARAQLAYRKSRRPCVFLDEDQRCRIYARRPLTCRMHHAITDPSWCWVDHDKAEDAVTPRLEPPSDILGHMKTIAARLDLELPTTLFGGLGLLGGQVMQTQPLTVRDETKTRRRARPKYRR
ncbi:Flagellin N-methylase [Enhygromyxa salina]|uniref:Flagellin N-methylase n=1 Tax=Enhygromyxa salina TaxID=215803 RepID=A0A2S9XF05_9BACT|nr:YkgJ family cysteine cluster protein [Enhygromyxa salina]PRP91456.1 Flagellin N-methylase [Enhygromyxa salina]